MRALQILLALHLLELPVHTTTAEATTLVHMRTTAIASSADRVVLGRVIATQARWVGHRIVTRVQLRPDAYAAGGEADMWFEHAGGTVDGLTMHVIGMPDFTPGEHALVLLAARSDGMHLLGLGEGKLPVVERDGQPVVYLRMRSDGPLEAVPVAQAHALLRRAAVRP
jgi:hypothetical protein